MKLPTLLAVALTTPHISVAAPGFPNDSKAKSTPVQAQERFSRLLDPKHLRAPGLAPAPGKAVDTLLESLTQVYTMDIWENFSLNKYFYGPDFRKAWEQYESWDPNASWIYAWAPRQKTTYVHADNGRLNSDTVWNLSDLGWTYLWNHAFAYNASGQPTEIQTEEWDELGWYPQSRMTYEYAGNGDQIIELQQSWMGGDSWVNTRQTLTTYDGPARAKTDLVQDWSDTDSAWTDNSRIVFKYASNGNLDSIVEEAWNESTTDWVNSWRTTYSFVSPGVVKEMISESWDDGWQKLELMRNTYLGTRLTQVEYLFWTGNWEDGQKIMHKYGPVVPMSVRKSAGRSGSLIRRVPGGNPQIRFDALFPEGAHIRVSILSVNGSRIGMPEIRRLVPGTASILWDGLDASGAQAAPGLYFLNVQGTKTQSLPFLLSR